MSTPTPATTHAPSHAAQAGARPAANVHGQRQAPVDLFATLLALAADATPLDAAATDPLAGDAPATDAKDPKDAGSEHPLAGLMLWQPPAIDKTATDAAAAGAEAKPLPADNALAARDTQAKPATEPGPEAQPTAPANAARPQGPSWQVSAMRAAQNAPAQATGNGQANSNASDAPAMRWSRGAPEANAATPAWSVRSTVTMDPRFPAASPQGLALGNPAARDIDAPLPLGEGARLGAPGSGPAAVAGPGGAPQGDLMGGGDGGDTPSPSARDEHTASTDPQLPTGEESEAVEVQHWGGAHGLRHASLRVGEEAGQAIDIQLALRGDEVRLDIRTDDSAAREALREQVQSALGERLQQGGLQLGDVSVGAQQQERQREGQATAQRRDAQPADTAAEAPAPARQGGSPGGLDLFI
ncbi:MAG: flagellar hook-length control protein FliK [Hydrogenophaga sp.]|nr:flagellar hook-length control protein FliK [Hydrogenophaga sp.]